MADISNDTNLNDRKTGDPGIAEPAFEGIAPLLTMINSCAEGMSVVNIDNGFGAGYLAARINTLVTQGNRP